MSKKKKKKEENQVVIINNIPPPKSPEFDALDMRTVNLYGPITEELAASLVSVLLLFEKTALETVMDETEGEPEQKIIARDINMFVSTSGGSAAEMFSILDIMEMIKKRTCDISTSGIGKVMSAGVPILAAGSKGKRKVGKNCRLMIHNVSASTFGSIAAMSKDLEEISWTQERYIESLTKNTKLTKSKIKKMLKMDMDVYLSAEDAIKWGIADEII